MPALLTKATRFRMRALVEYRRSRRIKPRYFTLSDRSNHAGKKNKGPKLSPIRSGIKAAIFSLFVAALNPTPIVAATPDAVRAILAMTPFLLVEKISAIPQNDLISVGMLKPNELLDQFLANRGHAYQSSDYLRGRLPQGQLLFAGVSEHYLLICYLRGAGRLSKNFVLLHRGHNKSEIAFRAQLFGTCRNIEDLKTLLEQGKFSRVPTSANFWFRKPSFIP